MVEDFDTYTEVDVPNNVLQQLSKTWFRVLNLDWNDTVYGYYDFGAGNITPATHGNIQFRLQMNTRTQVIYCYHWSFGNSLGDWEGAGPSIGLRVGVAGGVWRLAISEKDSGGTEYRDEYLHGNSTVGTDFYITVTWSGDQLTCYIYSDSGRTTLLDTLNITLQSSSYAFRYGYAIRSQNEGIFARRLDADIFDLTYAAGLNDGSADLKAEFTVSQTASEDLKAEFTVRQAAAEDLKAELVVRQAAAVNLFTQFTVRHGAVADLPAEFELQKSVALFSEFTVRQVAYQDLFAEFIPRRSAVEELKAELVVRNESYSTLYAEVIIRHSETRDLFAEFIPRRSAAENLKAEFTVRHTGEANLYAKMEIEPVADLFADFTVRQTRSLDLHADFYVRHPYYLWSNRHYVNGVIDLSEENISDAILEYVIEGVMVDVKGYLVVNYIQYDNDWSIADVPTLIKRAVTYGTVASLYAREYMGIRDRHQPSIGPRRIIVLDQADAMERAMEYWETKMITMLELYDSSLAGGILWVSTMDEEPVFSMADIPPAESYVSDVSR